MGIQWVYKGMHGYTRGIQRVYNRYTKGIRGVYEGYTKGIQRVYKDLKGILRTL